MKFFRTPCTLAAALLSVIVSCDRQPKPVAPAASKPAAGPSTAPVAVPPSPPMLLAAPPPEKARWTNESVQAEIKRHNPAYQGDGQAELDDGEVVVVSLRGAKIDNLAFLEKMRGVQAIDIGDTGVTNLQPLKGLKLVEFYMENTKVADISALRGMPLQKVYLSAAPVRDLGPLEGAPLTELNAVGILATDLTPLAKCPIQMLWLTGTPVENISALKSMPLVSVTLHRTKVKDLSPLSGTQLQRLHIAETPVEDLSPLKGLPLTRLVFTPANIRQGIDVARFLPVQEIGTRFDDEAKDLMPPAAFWEAFDAAKAGAKK
ncbi:MAG: hypothetical protein K1X78_04605 [Verrucomicrobiaceae bacterium]|nr:hypothetical protein [Verrucomicrobiaceae bacterium]